MRQEIDNYLDRRYQKAQKQRSEFVQQYNLADLRQRLSDCDRSQGELLSDASY
jgi:hypothetical protein